MQKTKQKISQSSDKPPKATLILLVFILGYVIIVKKDYDNPVIAFIGIYMLLEVLYYFWRYHKR